MNQIEPNWLSWELLMLGKETKIYKKKTEQNTHTHTHTHTRTHAHTHTHASIQNLITKLKHMYNKEQNKSK